MDSNEVTISELNITFNLPWLFFVDEIQSPIFGGLSKRQWLLPFGHGRLGSHEVEYQYLLGCVWFT